MISLDATGEVRTQLYSLNILNNYSVFIKLLIEKCRFYPLLRRNFFVFYQISIYLYIFVSTCGL